MPSWLYSKNGLPRVPDQQELHARPAPVPDVGRQALSKSMQLLRLLATKKTWRHTGELEQGEGRFPKQSGGSLSSLRLPAIVHAPPASLPGG